MNTVISLNGVVLVSYTALTKKQIEDLSVSISSFIYKEQNNIKNKVGTTRVASLYAQADDLKIWRVSPMWAASQYGSGASVVGVTAKNGIHVFESYYV